MINYIFTKKNCNRAKSLDKKVKLGIQFLNKFFWYLNFNLLRMYTFCVKMSLPYNNNQKVDISFN